MGGLLGWLARKLIVVVVLLIAAGNLFIVGAHQLASRVDAPGAALDGVPNFGRVDAQLWRGAAPSAAGLAALKAAGASAVVDLRAEATGGSQRQAAAALGLGYLHLQVRDGQVPDEAAIAAFVAFVDAQPGPVFVHCGAGVGRTGSAVAAWRRHSSKRLGPMLVWDNLRFGPPSLEQLYFTGTGDRTVPGPVVVVSRTMDAPRRIWASLHGR